MSITIWLKRFIFNRRLKSAIKRANELHKLTGYKYLVIRSFDEPLVLAKKRVKNWMKIKRISKEEMKKVILYETF